MSNVAPTEPQPPGPSGRSAPTVERILRNYRCDERKAADVARIATALFDAGSCVHGLPSSFAGVADASARMHGLSSCESVAHAPHILLQNGIAGMDAAQVALVSAAVGLGASGPSVDPAAPLAQERLTVARQIAALTSIAVAMADTGATDARVAYVDDTRHTVRVHIAGDPDGADLVAANAVAARWSGALVRRLRLVPDVGARYHVRPGDTMQAAAYKVFARLYADARSREDGVRRDTDIEDLHKFRVATRRLRAALRAFRPVFGREALQATADAARTVARSTNAARDLDVFLEALDDAGFAGRVPTLVDGVRSARADAIRETLTVLDGDAYSAFRSATESLLAVAHPQGGALAGRKARRRAGKTASAMVRQRLARVLAYAGAVSTDDDAGLHDLRIATKQLRYVLEFFADVLPEATSDVIEDMKCLQDSLGAVNDCAVQRDYVLAATEGGAWHDRASDVERVTTELLVSQTELRRERSLHTFRAEWERFTAPENQQIVSDRLNL